MGKDYKIGLVSGSILAVVALIWVATRPSLSPEARMLRSSQAMPHDSGVSLADPGSSQTGAVTDSRPENKGQGTQDAESSGSPSLPGSHHPQSEIRNPQSDGVPDLTIYEKPEKIKTTRFHIVRKEETLSAISRQYYGTPDKWQKILQANKKVIKDPNKLQPGTKLTIPE